MAESDVVIGGTFNYDPETRGLSLLVAVVLEASAVRNLRFAPRAKEIFQQIVQGAGIAAHQMLVQGLQTASTNPAIQVSGGNGGPPPAPPECSPNARQLELVGPAGDESPPAPPLAQEGTHNTSEPDQGPTTDSLP